MQNKLEKLIELAHQQIGLSEDPPNSNTVKYNTWYYGYKVAGQDYPWCMTFIQWVFRKAGISLPMVTASCGKMMNSALAQGLWFTENFRPGDVVIIDFTGKKKITQHCGLVVSVDADSIITIEGNTSANIAGAQDNGGVVAKKRRDYNFIIGAARPKEFMNIAEENEEEIEMKKYNTLAEIPDWGKPAVAWAQERKILLGDNNGNLDLSEDLIKALVFLYRYGLER